MLGIRAAIGAVLMLAGLNGFAPAASFPTQIPGWRYCSVAATGSATAYFSRVFASDSGIYAVGVANSFNAYVSARHDPELLSGATCPGLFDTAQEAEDDLNDHASRLRRNGRDVVFTRWTYLGD
jgi:hypothetical protein